VIGIHLILSLPLVARSPGAVCGAPKDMFQHSPTRERHTPLILVSCVQLAELSDVIAGLSADKEKALEAQRVQLESELVRVAGAGEAEEARLEEALRRDFQTITHTQQQAHITGQNQS
jgi:hypothetical protein